MRKFVTNRVLAIAAAMLAFGFAGPARAADPAAPAANPGNEARNAADPAGQPAETNRVDQMVADQLLQMSRGEVDLANFALKHTQNEEVRKFAQTMIQDHTNLNTQLERFASPGLRQNATGAPATDASAPAAAATEGKASGEQMGVQICQDIGRQIGAGLEKELGQYQGTDFDRAYVGQQFWGHVVFIGVAQGAENHISANLKQVVSDGANTAGKHLDDCRKLIRDLSANVAQGNTTAPRR